jgi:hypothetical protein
MFGPDECNLFVAPAFLPLLKNREKFLSYRLVPRFLGYAISQLRKLDKPVRESRKKYESKEGYDTKFAMNLVRLGLEVEQLLTGRALHYEFMRGRLNEVLGGELLKEDIVAWFEHQKGVIEGFQHGYSCFPDEPDYPSLSVLLAYCYEEFYGSLDGLLNVSLVERIAGYEV